MNKKILSMIIAASMAASATAAFAENEPAVVDDNAVLVSDLIDASSEGIMLISEDAPVEIEAAEGETPVEEEAIEIAPSFVSFEGLRIVAVDGTMIETVDENDNTVFVNAHK